MIDLHMHSTMSDGSDTVEEIIEKLKQKNIKYFAITDHDNYESAKILLEKKDQLELMGLKYTNGIELSIDFMGDSMHILVYDFDLNSPVLDGIIAKIFELRIARVKKRLEVLKDEFNIHLTDDEIKWLFDHRNPGKPHIAQILVNRGLAPTIHAAIQKYIYHEFNGVRLDAATVVKELSDNGYFVGIAHPLGGADEKRISVEKFMRNVDILSECGIKFLECYYSMYNEEERDLIRTIAGKYNLMLSGGSDSHRLNKTVILGAFGKDYVAKLEDLTVTRMLFK